MLLSQQYFPSSSCLFTLPFHSLSGSVPEFETFSFHLRLHPTCCQSLPLDTISVTHNALLDSFRGTPNSMAFRRLNSHLHGFAKFCCIDSSLSASSSADFESSLSSTLFNTYRFHPVQ